MGSSQAKTALIAALELLNTSVVAFYGPWGAGKTQGQASL
jgi:ABC-type lipopolysaccharide export system ATPase subunit